MNVCNGNYRVQHYGMNTNTLLCSVATHCAIRSSPQLKKTYSPHFQSIINNKMGSKKDFSKVILTVDKFSKENGNVHYCKGFGYIKTRKRDWEGYGF